MTRVVVDAPTRAKLRDLSEGLELWDEAGRFLGRFVPALDPLLHEGLEPRISPDEIRRRKQDKGKTYSTAEVLAHLEKQ